MKQQTEEYNGSEPLKSCLQEKFIQNMLKGMHQRDAYKQAGYKTRRVLVMDANASRLLTNANVKARMAHVRAVIEKKTREKIEYTREDAIAEYDMAIALAKQKGQPSTVCTAIAGKAALLGLSYKPAMNPVDKENAETIQDLRERLAEAEKIEAEAKTIQFESNKRVG